MFAPVRGMKDLYGVPAKKYRYIIDTARRIGEKYGYAEIKTPIVEATEVFHRSIGDETDVVSKPTATIPPIFCQAEALVNN